MKSFTEFITEGKNKQPESTDVMSLADMQKHIGKAKMNAIMKHPWYRDNFGHVQSLGVPVGMKYERNEHGFETVHVAHGPYGDQQMRKMAQFQLNYSGRKVDNVHLFRNWGNEVYDDSHRDMAGKIKWKHAKSLHSGEL